MHWCEMTQKKQNGKTNTENNHIKEMKQNSNEKAKNKTLKKMQNE